MSTQNQNNPQRGQNTPGTQANRTEPTTGKTESSRSNDTRTSDSRSLSGSSQTQRGERDESEILRCLDAIDKSVRECRTAMGNQDNESGSSRSASSSSPSKQQGTSSRSDESRDESSRDESSRGFDRNNPSR